MFYVIKNKDGYYFNDIEKTQVIWSEQINQNVKRFNNPLSAKIQIDRNLENCEIHEVINSFDTIEPYDEHFLDAGVYTPPKKFVYMVFINEHFDDYYTETVLFSTLKKAQAKMDEIYDQYIDEFDPDDYTVERTDTSIDVESDYGYAEVFLKIKEVL